MFLVLLKGFGCCGSLIVAIGAQNAFVIRQGILRRHLFMTALVCSIIDALLILSGVLGFGKLVTAYPLAIEISKYFAVSFLFIYGIFSFKSSFKPKNLMNEEEEALPSAGKTLFVLLALSLLNPHVYLDTVILLGSIASQHPPSEQIFFTIGAISASFLWFFSVTYGSSLLSPFLSKAGTWRILDILIAITMWGIAIGLLIGM